MILYLTFAAYCFAHLDAIFARIVGWLFTPWGYPARHRKGFRELSDHDMAVESYRWQQTRYAVGEPTQWLLQLETLVEQIPAPLCPPTYPVYETTAAPTRLVLRPSWRVDSGEIPIARIGELAEVAT